MSLEHLLKVAKARGVDHAEVVEVKSTSLSMGCRMGKAETVERSESWDVGLRILLGKRQAIISTSDTSEAALETLVDRAISMASVVPEDPYICVAEPSQLVRDIPSLDMCSPEEISEVTLLERALCAEEVARGHKGITNSEGADASWGRSEVRILTSHGFEGRYQSSRQGISCVVVAGEGDGMQRDYDYTTAIYGADLTSPEEIGKRAAERTLKRLHPQKMKTGTYPVIYERRLGGGYLLSPLVNAINGLNVIRGTSFLKDALKTDLFAQQITICDNPHLHRGLGSKPFDGEGLPASKQNIVEKGVLTTWLLNLQAANQLGMKPTGHGTRSLSSPPGVGVSNFYMEAGTQSPEELIASIDCGLYVTDLMGMGINGVTGDYSLGAGGYLIENGKIKHAISEVTIASNLKDMYKSMVVANDLIFDSSITTPTVLIKEMMVAGV